VALAATLAFGLVDGSAIAKKPKVKVASTVKIEGIDDSDYPPDVTVFGDVHSRKAKCRRNREVELRQSTDDIFAGTDTTDSQGHWAVTFDGIDVPYGDFEATVLKRRIVKKHKITVCKKDVVVLPQVEMMAAGG
jgi:hypothetical protein